MYRRVSMYRPIVAQNTFQYPSLCINPMMTINKSSPSTRHGGARGESRYSSYSFTTSALDGGEWSASRPGRALPPGKGPPVPIAQEAGWAPEPVWTQRLEEKSFAPAGDRTPIARSSSPYSDTILPELTRLLKKIIHR
jgi:hypothetical protein